MPRFPHFCKSFYFPFVSMLLLPACSGGGSSGNNSETGGLTPSVTISELGFSQQYYEGEPVTLSLQSQGEAASKLQFDWTVGNDIPFQGQGTDTITFAAPEVSGGRSVSVSVNISLEDGTLVGPKRQQGSVTILDTDPPDIVSDGFQTTLPEVESLDLRVFNGSELIAVDTFAHNNFMLLEQPVIHQRVSRRAAFVQESADSSDSVRLCGEQEPVLINTLTTPPDTSSVNCGNDQLTHQYYQQDADLRLETYCEDNLVFVRNIRGTTVDTRATQGAFTVEEDGFAVLEYSSQVCLSRTDELFALYDESIASPMKYVLVESSQYLLESEQGDGRVVFDLTGDAIVSSFESFHLDDLFNEEGARSATLIAPDHPTLDNLEASSGSFFVQNIEESLHRIELDLDFESEDGSLTTISAEVELRLP